MNCVANHDKPTAAVYTYQGLSLCDEHFGFLHNKYGIELRDALEILKYGSTEKRSAEMKRRRSLSKQWDKNAKDKD